MYILNTTFVVEPQVHDRWLEVLKNDYIPHLRGHGFGRIVFTRVVSEDAQPHHTYSLQVDAADIPQYRQLTGVLFDCYRRIADPLFGAQVCFFTTLLKKMDL